MKDQDRSRHFVASLEFHPLNRTHLLRRADIDPHFLFCSSPSSEPDPEIAILRDTAYDRVLRSASYYDDIIGFA
jgi:hypothetical protein